MMKAILGISDYYHDSAAAILVNGEISRAAREERFSRKKNDQNKGDGFIYFCDKNKPESWCAGETGKG
jgi:carbamoyltransferase